MRSLEEIESRISVLMRTRESITALEESGKLSPEQADTFRTVCNSTVNLLEWTKGNDVEAFTSDPVMDKVVLIAQDEDAFVNLELEDIPDVTWAQDKAKGKAKK